MRYTQARASVKKEVARLEKKGFAQLKYRMSIHNSVSLIVKHLTLDQKRSLAIGLSEAISENPDNLVALCDLIADLDQESIDATSPMICKYADTVIDSGDSESFARVAQLARVSKPLFNHIVLSTTTSLNQYIATSSSSKFLYGFKSVLLPKYFPSFKARDVTEDEEAADSSILKLFAFLDSLFMSITSESLELDNLICYFMGNVEDSISNAASKLVRWRLPGLVEPKSSKFVWDIIFILIASGKKNDVNHGYIFWLRYMNSNSDLRNDKLFQNEIIQDSSYNYWGILQQGLVSESHELRKFSLSILQLTVKAISVSFSSEIMSWEVENRERSLKEWSRYTTLYEILGIDTSLHQAQGAIDDIVSLISPSSIIHPSWGFCLLSNGFKAGMDSVRKFTLNVILSIPHDHLYLLKHSLPILETTFLPYMMLASHFAVRQRENTNEFHCPYGTGLTGFIANFVGNLTTDEEFDEVVYSLLLVLVNFKDAFDPSRIYITLGIVKGLGKRQVLQYGKHDTLLLKLFEATCEGKIFETTSQTLNLKLLLNFKSEKSSLISTLSTFVKFNGYVSLKSNLDLFNSIAIDDVEGGDDEKIILFMLANNLAAKNNLEKLTLLLSQQAPRFLSQLLESSCDFKALVNEQILAIYSDLFEQVFSGKSTDIGIYQGLSNANFPTYGYLLPEKIKLVELWAVINTEVQSSSLQDIQSCTYKFKLFNNLLETYAVKDIENHELFEIGSLLKFHSLILNNAQELSRTVTDFYRVKEDLIGQYLRCIAIVSSRTTVSNIEIDSLLSLLVSSSSNFRINWSVASILNNIVNQQTLSESLAPRFVEFTHDLWENLNSSRLQLNQKDLHVLIIDTLMNPFILERSSNEFIGSHLLKFGVSVLTNAQGRRSLLPCLTHHLSNFQLKSPEVFEQIEWIAEILVRSFITYQLRNNTFRLENIIGHLYDSEIKGSGDIYRIVYGPEELSARINLMAIFNSVRSSSMSLSLLRFIFDHDKEFNLVKVLRSVDGFEEWRRIQLFSIILCVIDKVESKAVEPFMERYISIVETEPSPLARVYLEWIISLYLTQNESFIQLLLDKLKIGLKNNTLKPSMVTVYERILFLSVQHLLSSKESKYLSQLLTAIISFATSNKATTRHFSLSLNCAIFPEIKAKALSIRPDILEVSESLFNSAIASESFGQFRSGDALLWDIKQDLTMVSISGGVLLRVSDRDVDFLRKEDYIKWLSPAQISRLTHPVGENLKELWIKTRKNYVSKTATSFSNAISQSPLQTKSGAWSTVMDVDETSRGGDVVRSDLIVVSSLVDKPPNLGGICRLCDVLGAGLLTLNDIRVKDHPQFKNVAVTADYWMPMQEVKEANIIEFLKLKKKEGYTLVGLEQTDKSVELNGDLKFPKKTLVLLGKEKEGVPGDILAELDFCVEIKQVGVIRSMNIQTATAVIVHAYSVQHC